VKSKRRRITSDVEANVWRSMDVGVRTRDMAEEDMGISLVSDVLVFNIGG
jgi:hypothetical protein